MIKKRWFYESIQDWSPELEWSDPELNDLGELLVEIARLNQAEIFPTGSASEAQRKEFALRSLKESLDGLARSYARAIDSRDDRTLSSVPTASFTTRLSFTRAQTHATRVNLNNASRGTLETLPGIGKVTAKRIEDYRRQHGSFASLEDVKRVKGIGAQEVEEFARLSTVRPPSGPTRISSAEFATLLAQPTFQNYVRATVARGIGLSRFEAGDAADPKQRVVAQLRGFLMEQQQRLHHPYRTLPGTSVETMRNRSKQRRNANRTRRHAIEGPAAGVLLDDSEYPLFLERLLKKARKRVHIIMFFMRFEDEKRYPTDGLFAELLSARQRDADVRVILDRDAEGDSINSRVINEEAYEYLRKHDIPVLFDSVERYTHTKLVLVDDRHVVLGSHNWTAGSFFAYDDTSLYVESPRLLAHYEDQFETLWAEYA